MDRDVGEIIDGKEGDLFLFAVLALFLFLEGGHAFVFFSYTIYLMRSWELSRKLYTRRYVSHCLFVLFT